MLFGKRYIRTTAQMFRELKVQFIQSASPKQTALSVTIGFYAGIFPVFGLTTALCVLMTILFRANHLISVAVNLLVAPLQMLLIVPFVKVGLAILNPDTKPSFQTADDLFALLEQSESWYFLFQSLIGGVICWAIFSSATAFPTYRLLRRRINANTQKQH
ncbi:DUF2062 domain-containing protein [Mangrovibacterium diazotrophicum]|uniref:Uncharacterized protein DUF2062 n=1 Tax=Mangrovibacterium diazotrophicum TaxID=1261403 RepID=A0A419VX80_9BACT|nr:DUF2062 domain-containing protein [Mangrovibacterium diazotrophicum]RKD87842.1 uncharacterized protein DUF2062 [Mangrovibacterium diazotrophicum]